MQDFGVAMKLDDGRLLIQNMARLLKLFLHFDASYANEYKKCILVNLLLWAYHIDNGMPIWQMMEQNASVCNEEAGELAFSVLGRTIGSNSSRTDIDLVNRHFILSKLKLEVAKDLDLDIADQETVQVHSHYKIPENSPEVARVAAHFYNIVTNLKHNFFHHYPTSPATDMYSFKNKIQADKHLVSSNDEEVKEWFIWDAVPKLNILIEKTKKAMSGQWLADYKEDWPVKEVVNDMKSDDEKNIVDNDEVPGTDDDTTAEYVEDEKAPVPEMVEMSQSPVLIRRRSDSKRQSRPNKRQRPVSVSDGSDGPAEANQNNQAHSEENNDDVKGGASRPQRKAKPRYRMVDEGSEAASNFMEATGWNGNMNSDDDE